MVVEPGLLVSAAEAALGVAVRGDEPVREPHLTGPAQPVVAVRLTQVCSILSVVLLAGDAIRGLIYPSGSLGVSEKDLS